MEASTTAQRLEVATTGAVEAHPDPPPSPLAPDPAAEIDPIELSSSYLNRELTWLAFNERVLHEAEDERTPLLERLKFLAITGSNLDEFFMKRIGGLKQQVGAGVYETSVDGRTPQVQIDECYQRIRRISGVRRALASHLFAELAQHGVRVVRHAALEPEQQAWVKTHYDENIFPLVTPQAMDPAHPFPFVSNLSLNLLVSLHHRDDEAALLARVKVPLGAGTKRFIQVGDEYLYVPLEEVIAANLDLLFPDMEVDQVMFFRVTRNANTETDEDQADDLLEMIESELRERRFAPIVRLEIATGMPPQIRGMLAAELGLDEEADVFETDGMMALRNLMELVGLPLSPLRDPDFYPLDFPDFLGDRSVFHTIRDAGSLLVQHPYDSFTTSVVRFLHEAALDPKVRAIKMTLYRTASESDVIEALFDAARNGKQVTVVVELKARFDEAANIRWANRLESSGIHVTYGVVGLKTHCKAILVVRQDYGGLRLYSHIGTGNYHSGTARLYSDLGLFTSDRIIGRDLLELFNYLTTGYKPRRDYRKLLVAPKLMKAALLQSIDREIQHQEEGRGGHIQLKTNALEDVDVTRALYRASRAGVKIELIVRDSCHLRAGVPGLSENITVISIVGRFLEHARLYYFRDGGEERYYIGSADLMRRNLQRRVELLTPVEAPELRAQLRRMLDTQLADRRSAWQMQPDGSYVQRHPIDEADAVGCQQAALEWTEQRYRQATRLKKRKPKGMARRKGR